MKYDFFIDPGHGWLKVPRKKLVELGIETDITDFSYQRGDYVYLEEDCDMGLFCKAVRAAGDEPKWRERYADRSSKIRSYARYSFL